MHQSSAQLFARSEESAVAAYERLLAALAAIGPHREEAKKTSIHLVSGSSFAGVHPQKSKFRLNIRLDEQLEGPRIRKTERVSANRFHNEIDITQSGDIDVELIGWLSRAYDLAGRGRRTS